MALPETVTDDQLILLTYQDALYAYGADQRDSAEESFDVAEAAGVTAIIGVMPAANWAKARQVMEDYIPALKIHDMRELAVGGEGLGRLREASTRRFGDE